MDDSERTKQNRRRARNWALLIAAVAIAFYVSIFFVIEARY